MQQKPTRKDFHPAESVASTVFITCCRTLGALRNVHVMSEEHSATDPDSEYQKTWKEYLNSDYPFLQEWLQHPVDFVDWNEMLGRMNSLTFNERHYKNLAYKQKLDLHHVALHNPQLILPLAVTHAAQIVELRPRPSDESPDDAARPFPLAKVLGWLGEMGLITEEGNRIQSKASCFESIPKLRFTGLGLDTVRSIAEWVTGPLGPPARELPFHLLGQKGQPGMAREILYCQGMSAPNETHIALLHMLPVWSEEQKSVLMDMILASWIRAVEVYGNSSGFKAECAAGVVHRWQNILRDHLPNIPTAQTRAKGASAGFIHL